jgi:hypothetical protein
MKVILQKVKDNKTFEICCEYHKIYLYNICIYFLKHFLQTTYIYFSAYQ